jgi:hypothetical protein
MEKDRDFEVVRKWYTPASKDEELAFEYLSEVIKKTFMSTEEGVKLSELVEFLEQNGFTLEVLRAVGFDTHSHFLFHLDSLLEVRGKKINDRIYYFAFVKEKLRRDAGKLVRVSEEKLSQGYVYHQSSFPASYSKILNLHRNILSVPLKLIPPERPTESIQKAKTVPVVPPVKAPVPEKAAIRATPGNNASSTFKPNLNVPAKKNKTRTVPLNDFVARPPEVVQKILRTHVFEEPDSPRSRYCVPGIGPLKFYNKSGPKPKPFKRSYI